MKQILPDLWETETENPAKGLYTHAYLLTRERGNVLFYNTGHRHEIENMAALGGVAYQFLSHRDELGETLATVRTLYGAKLGGHVREREDFARILVPDIQFDERTMVLDDVEVIPVPGHTPGSTCFLVHSKTGNDYLFTGDTLYRGSDGTWKAGLIPGYSEREPLVESLELLAGLRPDVVIGSAFGGVEGYQVLDAGEWPSIVRHTLEQLADGAGNDGRRETGAKAAR